MSHNHSHAVSEASEHNGRCLFLAMLINLAIPAAQIAGGILADSMAVISDAVHNFGDFTALALSFIALRIASKTPSRIFSFGYFRAEILAALANAVILIGASAFILNEAFSRIIESNPVSGKIVIIMALVGIAGNGLSVYILHKGDQKNLNMRSAVLHMLADLFTSVAVLINGIVLHFLPWYWLDPLLSLVIVFFILRGVWHILKESTLVLMEAVPAGINLEQVKNALEDIPGVSNVHHLHAWNIGSGMISFTAHVAVPDDKLSCLEEIKDKVKKTLHHKFEISHAVLELESDHHQAGDMLCKMQNSPAHGHK